MKVYLLKGIPPYTYYTSDQVLAIFFNKSSAKIEKENLELEFGYKGLEIEDFFTDDEPEDSDWE